MEQSEVLRLMLLVIVAMGSQSVLNAGAWTQRDAAVGKKCKAQSAVLCLSHVSSFCVVIVDE